MLLEFIILWLSITLVIYILWKIITSERLEKLVIYLLDLPPSKALFFASTVLAIMVYLGTLNK